MTSLALVTDSSANLPIEIIRQYELTIVPLSYFINGQEHTCIDSSTFDGDAFYAGLKDKNSVSTSLVNASRFMEYFEPLLQQGQDVLYIGMSSGISGSYHSSVIAAEELRERYPQQRILTFDTLAASLGEGLQVIHAAQLREEGLDLDQIFAELLHRRPLIRQIFTVDDLMHLRRGGRISGVAAAVGSLLHVKPILIGNEEGKIVVQHKVRGRRGSIRTLAEAICMQTNTEHAQTIGIAHAGCAEDAQTLADLILAQRPQMQVLTVCYEPVTGSHVGPGALALFYQCSI